tara:strand:+ start:720 stop:1007 length:288 start_codon:yes stop_codon:yes gene_type:complete
MARFKMVDGVKVQLTDDEEKARDAEEKAWADAAPARAFEGLRVERDGKLAETDFYALSDVTLSDAMKKYRQDLRDLPSKYDNSSVVKTITWPSKP